MHIRYGTTLDLTLFSGARLRMQQSNYKNQKEGKALSFTAWGTKRPKFSAKKSLEADFPDIENYMTLIFWS